MKTRILTLLFAAFALAAHGQSTFSVSVDGSGNIKAPGTLTFPSTKSLQINGTLGGTPTGGALNLGSVTLTLPAGFVTTTGSQTLTNKTLAIGSNTVSGSLAEFNAALTGADFAAAGANTDITAITGLTGNVVTTAGNFQTTTGLARFGIASATTERLYVKDNGMAGNQVFAVHADDSSPWCGSFFNDTYSTTVAGLLFYIDNAGFGNIGTEGAKSWGLFTNSAVGSNCHLTLSHSPSQVQVNKDLALTKTITAGGTTGAQTINKTSGSVNLAASATSLVVTNSFVTANSIILLSVGTNDASNFTVRPVAASGSFTIHVVGTAPAAETRVNFIVTN